MFSLLNMLKIGLGAGLGAIVTFGAVMTYVSLVTVPSARVDERNIVLSEARERAMELINKRNEDNAEISLFDQAQLCVELGGEWVLADNTCN